MVKVVKAHKLNAYLSKCKMSAMATWLEEMYNGLEEDTVKTWSILNTLSHVVDHRRRAVAKDFIGKLKFNYLRVEWTLTPG